MALLVLIISLILVTGIFAYLMMRHKNYKYKFDNNRVKGTVRGITGRFTSNLTLESLRREVNSQDSRF